jgi:hypothetical protein
LPQAGEAVDKSRLTQVGGALERLGIEHIAAYSAEARGRSERMFGTLAVFHGPRRIARYDAEGAELLTAGSLTPRSPSSRRGMVAGEFAASASRRPALTAVARGVPAPRTSRDMA